MNKKYLLLLLAGLLVLCAVVLWPNADSSTRGAVATDALCFVLITNGETISVMLDSALKNEIRTGYMAADVTVFASAGNRKNSYIFNVIVDGETLAPIEVEAVADPQLVKAGKNWGLYLISNGMITEALGV